MVNCRRDTITAVAAVAVVVVVPSATADPSLFSINTLETTISFISEAVV